MNELIQFDRFIFDIIHSDLSNVFFDFLMPILRNKFTWIPLYVFIIAFSFLNMKVKNAALFVASLILTVVISDFTSSQLIKKSVERPRPCREITMESRVDPLVRCGSGYSFPSSHAANHFAIAFFIILGSKDLRNWIKSALILWAAAISLAQVYVGVHYPIDILAGTAVGYFVARIVTFTIALRKSHLPV